MGTLFSTLDIGRAGLQVAQIQLDVTAHNIASVNKEGFSRQRASITTNDPLYRPYGAIGRGPKVQDISRLRESFLDEVIREKFQDLGYVDTRSRFFSRIEDLFQEPGDTGFSQNLDNYFDAMSDFASNVEDLPVRVSLLSEADSLTTQINTLAQRIASLRTNANEEVRGLVPEINSLSSRIAELNRRIRDSELSGHQANDLRDDRDMLLDDLSGLVNITYRERTDGQVDILLGGDSLVRGDDIRELEAVPDPSLDPVRGDLLRVQWVDTGIAANVTGGELGGSLDIRDQVLVELDSKIDTLASSLIYETNRVHAQGNGLVNIDSPITSLHGVSGIFTPLSSAGLPFAFDDGSFDIVVYDSGGNITAQQTINVTNGATTMSNLVTDINAVAGVSAIYNGADGTVTLVPQGSNTIGFANDSSGVLAAIGLNPFFTGSDASDIGVSQDLLDRPELVSSAFSTNVADTGDNTAALAMSNLRNQAVLAGDTQSINEYYEAIVVGVGVDSRANDAQLNVEQAFVDDFELRRQEVSGVNLDEEVTFLLQFQRAFEGAARVITVTDRLLETLINIVR
ncbi:flagellar hook-associated protein FlgK [Roseovarius pacificus]|uniref:flagellar hook-associated protein FlgK n=1 Tax=Roseovarius pacificus TaxID=337701 RepID=UPI002A18A324|nr:flagellar hook-associated protein FlgK [Roseovarius pacificus]